MNGHKCAPVLAGQRMKKKIHCLESLKYTEILFPFFFDELVAISSQILEIIKQTNGMTTWVLDTTFLFKTLNKYLRNELKRLHVSLHFAFSLLCIHNFYNILLFLWDTQPANATNYMLFLKKQSFIKWCFQSQILKAVGEIMTESWNFNEELEIEQKVANELDVN